MTTQMILRTPLSMSRHVPLTVHFLLQSLFVDKGVTSIFYIYRINVYSQIVHIL